MNEIAVILIVYAIGLVAALTIDPVIAVGDEKWQAWPPLLRAVYQIMQLQKLVNMFGGDLMRRYGEKVHKLTLHGGFSCPNRDGTLGRGGCTFCNVASFADEAQQHRSIAEQLAHQAQLVNRAKRYLAYFQAYTSTFAEVQVLRSMYRQAVSAANIVGLCVGTARTAFRRRSLTC